ncbi:MAG: hypothetical protein K9M10_03525 [Candidatus Pacebacteria bacterium]|nr:hypothetical protein [Candidatus Paceibacterota bacterium]MCF7857521.1 hypothetical protein [Candidatus Paceibacterota bacterium]
MSIIISSNGEKATKVDKSPIEKEDFLQQYIYENPESIPLYEIKEDIQLLILAREFPTNSGPIDAIGIDKYGDIYIVETKLYANADKRRVVAQSLDYGAALWKHANDFSEFIAILDAHCRSVFKQSLEEKIGVFFNLDTEEVSSVLNQVQSNLNQGIFHFVVLMDKLDDRLKDLILYVNQNSQFDIYAVELEYYKHQTQEIIIPRLFGAEVKKDIKTVKSGSSRQWDWSSFKDKLHDLDPVNVTVARQILDWMEANDIQVSWSKSQIGSFIPQFRSSNGKYFYPFAISGDGRISWNAPHQGNYAPVPFNDPEQRREILKQLHGIKCAQVDIENVDGYNGCRIPLECLANVEELGRFFSICTHIKQNLA